MIRIHIETFCVLLCCLLVATRRHCLPDDGGKMDYFLQAMLFPASLFGENNCDIDPGHPTDPGCQLDCDNGLRETSIQDKNTDTGVALAHGLKFSCMGIGFLEDWLNSAYLSSSGELLCRIPSAVYTVLQSGTDMLISTVFTAKDSLQYLLGKISANPTTSELFEDFIHGQRFALARYSICMVVLVVLLPRLVTCVVMIMKYCFSIVENRLTGLKHRFFKPKPSEQTGQCLDSERTKNHHMFCESFAMKPCNCSGVKNIMMENTTVSGLQKTGEQSIDEKKFPCVCYGSTPCLCGSLKSCFPDELHQVMREEERKDPEDDECTKCGKELCVCEDILMDIWSEMQIKGILDDDVEELIDDKAEDKDAVGVPLDKQKLASKHYLMCECFDKETCNCGGRLTTEREQTAENTTITLNVQEKLPAVTENRAANASFRLYLEQPDDHEIIAGKGQNDESFVESVDINLDSGIGEPRHNSSFKEDIQISPRKYTVKKDAYACGDGPVLSTLTRRSPFKQSGLLDLSRSADDSIADSEATSILDVSDINNSLSVTDNYGIVEVALMFMIQTAWRFGMKVIQNKLASRDGDGRVLGHDTSTTDTWVKERSRSLFHIRQKPHSVSRNCVHFSKNNSSSAAKNESSGSIGKDDIENFLTEEDKESELSSSYYSDINKDYSNLEDEVVVSKSQDSKQNAVTPDVDVEIAGISEANMAAKEENIVNDSIKEFLGSPNANFVEKFSFETTESEREHNDSDGNDLSFQTDESKTKQICAKYQEEYAEDQNNNSNKKNKMKQRRKRKCSRHRPLSGYHDGSDRLEAVGLLSDSSESLSPHNSSTKATRTAGADETKIKTWNLSPVKIPAHTDSSPNYIHRKNAHKCTAKRSQIKNSEPQTHTQGSDGGTNTVLGCKEVTTSEPEFSMSDLSIWSDCHSSEHFADESASSLEMDLRNDPFPTSSSKELIPSGHIQKDSAVNSADNSSMQTEENSLIEPSCALNGNRDEERIHLGENNNTCSQEEPITLDGVDQAKCNMWQMNDVSNTFEEEKRAAVLQWAWSCMENC